MQQTPEMPMRFATQKLCTVLAVTFVVTWAFFHQEVSAQLGFPFGHRFDESLQKSDMEILRPGLRDLLENGADHSEWAWNNDQTGNGGMVELKHSFNHQNMACRKIEHVVKFKGQQDARRIGLNYCRTGAEEWKILAQ